MCSYQSIMTIQTSFMCGFVACWNYKHDEAGHKCVAIVRLDCTMINMLCNQQQWLRNYLIWKENASSQDLVDFWWSKLCGSHRYQVSKGVSKLWFWGFPAGGPMATCTVHLRMARCRTGAARLDHCFVSLSKGRMFMTYRDSPIGMNRWSSIIIIIVESVS